MGREPQPVANTIEPGAYRPAKPLLALADWLADPVRPADFPQTELRWRNDRWAAAVGLDALSDAEWIRHFARFDPLPVGRLRNGVGVGAVGRQVHVFDIDTQHKRPFDERAVVGHLAEGELAHVITPPVSRLPAGTRTLGIQPAGWRPSRGQGR